MTLRSLCGGLLALALMAGPSLAQKTPVFQSGKIIPGDLSRFDTNGLISDVYGLAGNSLGVGANPFSVQDRDDIGLSFNTGPSDSAYQALQLGHDADGNALIRLRSFNGAPETGLLCDINGAIDSCFGISPLSTLTISDQTVLGNLSGRPANPYAVLLSDLFSTAFSVPDPADAAADDTGMALISAEGRGKAREKVSLGKLLHHQQTNFYGPNVYPQLVDAATAGDTYILSGTGFIIWNISNLSFNEDFTFGVQGSGATAYLDVGPNSVFSHGNLGQMLRIDDEQTVTIRRVTNGIFRIVSSYIAPLATDPPPGSLPIRFLTADDSLGGTFQLPALGGGKEYSNITGSALTFDLSAMTQASVYWISTGATETATLNPEGWTILGLGSGQTMTIGPATKLPITRWTLGIYVVGNGASSLSASTGFPLANLPLGVPNGTTVTCSNCRKPGQSTGAGTGMRVFWDAASSAWYSTAGTVAAI